MENKFSTLVNHGAAPFQHFEKNGPSYFAVLRDSEGQESTVWGIDIERCLHEAGAVIGDSVSLVKGGKEPVTVKIENDKGVMEDKIVDRFIWHAEVEPFEIEVTPSKELKKDITESKVAPSESEKAMAANEKAGDGLFAVMAPYMLDGLHNHLGVALAEKLNERINKAGLAGNENGIREMLDADPEAAKFMLAVVKRQRYLEDQHRRQNRSEPDSLMGGLFVRDDKGDYRSAAGGPVVLADKGDALTLKSKTPEAYRAAIELAAAKGWTSIELKGKPAMMAGVWLEAQMMGLNVVNYKPTDKDLDKLAERVAERDKAAAAAKALESNVQVQEPEQVEVREFAGADGKTHVATISYTVSYEHNGQVKSEEFGSPKDAAKLFAEVPTTLMPTVLRGVMQVDGNVKSSIIASTDSLPGLEPVRTANALADHEFAEAFDFAMGTEKARELAALNVVDVVKAGLQITGKILKVEGGIVYQDRGCGSVFKHDANSLTRIPKEGEREVIKYDKDGRGVIKDRELERVQEQGLELAR